MRRLRLYFAVFFLLLAVPFAVLLVRSYSNVEGETFAFYRRTAEGVAATVNRQLLQLLRREEERSYTEYRYVHVAGGALPEQEGLYLSPLAAYPVQSEIPGILGYFQIDPDGSFHTPLLPRPGSPADATVRDREARGRLQRELRAVASRAAFSPDAAPAEVRKVKEEKLQSNLARQLDLSKQRDYDPAPAAAAPEKQVADDRLGRARREASSPRQAQVFDSWLPSGYRTDSAEQAAALSEDEGRFQDRAGEPAESDLLEEGADWAAEVGPFRSERVGDWLVFHREVRWGDRGYRQGFVVRLAEFFDSQAQPALRSSALPETAGFLLFYQGDVVPAVGDALSPGARKPVLLHHAALAAPAGDFDLAIAVDRLPTGSGYRLLGLLAVLLTVVLAGGFVGIYRLTATQMELSRKQSDFVSAVSHELKTPLTSIRMYGEMLTEGWVGEEEKKQAYYRRIHDESQRLSRLIENVLRLAQLERDEWQVSLTVRDPVQLAREAVASLEGQVRRAGFEIELEVEGEPRPVSVDTDALTQILINLVDNALKFARESEQRKIVIRVSQTGEECCLHVRDFGPGIPRRELKRIFQQFYRVGGELTRTAEGTGIGLALVRMLAEAMGASVDVRNCRPGAEFSVRLQAAGS